MGRKMNEYSFGYAVGLNRWSMRLLGLWPLDERFSTLKWSMGFIVTLAFLFPSMGRMVTIIDSRSIIEQAVLTVPLGLLLAKLCYMRVKAKRCKCILEVMTDDWYKFSNLPDWAREIMIRYAKKGRQVNIICISCMMISSLGYMSLPSGQNLDMMLENATLRKLPTEGLYPFDSKQSPVYEILYTSQAIVSCLYCMITFSIDCFLSIVVFHGCGQFAVLTKSLTNYGKDRMYKDIQENVHSYTCACLKCIVQQHTLITNYMKTVEKSFNEFVLLQLMGNCLTLAAEGYGVVTYAEDNNAIGFLTFVAYTTTVTYNIFIYCYVGDCIVEKSERIADAAYNLEWNDLPQHLAKPLILLMVRSRRSCRITAGRFAVMTLSYYKHILTTAFSYMSLLRALK